jgi:hypothetical protein
MARCHADVSHVRLLHLFHDLHAIEAVLHEEAHVTVKTEPSEKRLHF